MESLVSGLLLKCTRIGIQSKYSTPYIHRIHGLLSLQAKLRLSSVDALFFTIVDVPLCDNVFISENMLIGENVFYTSCLMCK